MNWQPIRKLAREAVIFTLLGPVAVALGYMAIQMHKAPSPAPHSVARMCPNYLAKKEQPAPASQPAPPVKPGWARISTSYDTNLYKRCHFNGYMGCLGELDESVATLHQGEEVKLLSAKTRASDGKEIIQVAFQKWTGWIEASDIAVKIVWDDAKPVAPADWASEQAQLPCLDNARVGDTIYPDDPMHGDLHTLRFNKDYYIQDYQGTWLKFPNGYATPVDQLNRVVNKVPLTAYVHPTDAGLIGLVFGWPFGFAAWLAYRILRFAIKG